MSPETNEPSSAPGDERPSAGGFGAFLKETWVWWVTPLVLALILLAILLYFSESQAASPFIYDNF
jgi:hypothetical protein